MISKTQKCSMQLEVGGKNRASDGFQMLSAFTFKLSRNHAVFAFYRINPMKTINVPLPSLLLSALSVGMFAVSQS